ncbi:amidohydrolase/deacetylase family metallohydrolase [Schlesneria sp. T3-172]|uniref:amidohydrolase/deacetylase family metallohydrolase n=1 Tax=Schlesneria sphaerica TaxID=3373610 RepID=UPI0037CB7BDA
MYDVLLKGARVVDPSQELDGCFDVAILGGRIAALLDPASTPLESAAAIRVVDVRGKIVVPGLIDFHVHVFPGVSHFGIDPDPTCLARGVTTVLDFGTAGGLIFDGFRQFVIDEAQTRVLALLHIAGQGLIGSVGSPPLLGELHDLRYCDLDTLERTYSKHRDVILGVKIRCTADLAEGGRNEAGGLEMARKGADLLNLPLVIHSPNSSLSIEHVLDRMKPGDVLTHCYHGKDCGLVDQKLKIPATIRDKLQSGVLLDVGHGFSSFNFSVARSLLDQEVLPDFISSDIHFYNLHGPVYDLLTTMDKFLHLGMPLAEVIRRTTQTPAKFLGRQDDLGTLKPGAIADITVLELQEGEFVLEDSEGNREIGRHRLDATHVFRSGRQIGVLPKPSPAVARA